MSIKSELTKIEKIVDRLDILAYTLSRTISTAAKVDLPMIQASIDRVSKDALSARAQRRILIDAS